MKASIQALAAVAAGTPRDLATAQAATICEQLPIEPPCWLPGDGAFGNDALACRNGCHIAQAVPQDGAGSASRLATSRSCGCGHWRFHPLIALVMPSRKPK